MKDFGKVRSGIAPKPYESTSKLVFVATDIVPYKETIDNYVTEGYEYNYKSYTKDEYIQILAEDNEKLKAELLDTQAALCDVYELLEGGN